MTREPPIPETMTLHVPFRIVKRGGRKEMQLPHGVRPDRRMDNTLVKALARAFRWKRLLESGEYATVSELAEREGIAPSYITRVLRLTLLAPDIRTHHIRFLLETRSSQGNKEGKRRLLQRDEFESIEFTLPPLETQREIAAKLAVFRADFDLTVREIEALTRQKRGLMQKLLTGEWRVSP